ncbi:peptide chain release factor 3 [Demetria terragena]|uniref:peptide chain release factor 3 n=1 Tax=Demetria terragena TaxID=63959 RepID=UPI000364CA79|nr:peptide chain release factor 3 [Demetria terragena]
MNTSISLPRRTFAVISHPDAGKSTLTEALALHADALDEAGAVHGKRGRRATVSDWMDMEKARGISVSSTALQFTYRDHVLNLVDTPGHADFSEDTYRVLSAVDCAIMLVDAAKGLEEQTLKLFRVCAQRGIPIITVINKWDRPGMEPLELMDEIERDINVQPTPLTWPVGIAGEFRGVLERSSGDFVQYEKTPGGATKAQQQRRTAAEAQDLVPDEWTTAHDEAGLLEAVEATHDQQRFLAGESTPVLFASALLNFGVSHLLDTLVELAPGPAPAVTVSGDLRGLDEPFSAMVFKVQAGMDPAHRDRLAFARVQSGMFERGMTVTHVPTGRPLTTKHATVVFGRERSTVEQAVPGDIIGLVNSSELAVGDTISATPVVEYPRIVRFNPEHFAVARARDTGRFKQFRSGIEQLDHEGAIQVLRSDLRGNQAPVLAAVGPMQFDVVKARMEHEFRTVIDLETLPYSLAREVTTEQAPVVNRERNAEVLHRSDGTLLALFSDKWRAQAITRAHPDLGLVLTD